MNDDWKDVKVAVVGNFNPPESGRRYQAEVLAEAFQMEGARVLRITTEQNRFKRPLATAVELIRGRTHFDSLCVQAFSNWNFVNAAVATSVGRSLRKRIVVVYRGGAAPLFLRRFGPLVRPILRLADALVVPSGYLEQVFRGHGLRPCIIPNVIDLSQFPYRERSMFVPKLIWVRHLREGYNPRMAIEAFREVQLRRPNATLTMVGEGPLRRALEAEVRSLDLAGVRFTGQLPQSEVAEHLNQAEIFISTTNYDNQPRSVLEAMAAGLPVVSTRVGGVPYLIQDRVNGILIEPDDASAMARAVLSIVEEPAVGRQLVANARTGLQAFLWTSVSPAWLATLSSSSS